MKRYVILSLAALLGLQAPCPASADCGGPGCALAIGTGIGGAVFAGILLVPVSVESYYLARNERPPPAAPIVSFVLVSTLILPTALMWISGDRTGEPGFWAAGVALSAAAAGGLVLGIVSLAKDDQRMSASATSEEGLHWALTPTFGQTRGAALTVVGF